MERLSRSFISLNLSTAEAMEGLKALSTALDMLNKKHRSNNWLKMHGYPKRRKNGRKNNFRQDS